MMRSIRRLLPDGIIGPPTESKRRSLLRLLLVASSRSIPTSVVTLNLASEYRDRYGHKLERLAVWLKANSSLGAALTHTPGVLSENDSLLIRCGSEVASDESVVRFILEQDDASGLVRSQSRINQAIGYTIALLLISLLTITFLTLFILPTIIQIFEEFALELPPAMLLLVQASRELGWLWPVFVAISMVMVLSLMFEDVRRNLADRIPFRWLPGRREQECAGLLRLFAFPTEHGLPLADTITSAALHHPNRSLRRKLLEVRSRSNSDSECFNSLAGIGMIGTDHALSLARIDDHQIRSWALLQLASQLETRTRFRRDRVIRVAQYLPVLIVAIPIAWCVIAIFQTLTQLIHSL
ncbi:hypothetical protein U8335_06525 [Roseiconus lacunae]|uniref:hypothetical protein n=1 Tax=Roseiconus lacunae TaxID=2605694 RepID=UPI0030883D82|nr:hypothetical protein U8335_06525 [Stieleria sp. HD01]